MTSALSDLLSQLHNDREYFKTRVKDISEQLQTISQTDFNYPLVLSYLHQAVSTLERHQAKREAIHDFVTALAKDLDAGLLPHDPVALRAFLFSQLKGL